MIMMAGGRSTRSSYRACLGLIAWVGLGGMVMAQGLPNPVTAPGAPWAFHGFVVNSPDGLGFYSAYKNELGASFAKKQPEPDHTYVLTVMAARLDAKITNAEELVQYMLQKRNKEIGTRFRIKDFAEEKYLHQAYICSRYLINAEDKGVRLFSWVRLLMDGITCVHPEQPQFAVDVGFSERAGKGDYNPQFKEVGEKFVKSLRFLPWPEREDFRNGMKARMANEGRIALDIFNPMIGRGDTLAAMRAGEIYLSGAGVPTDYEIARKLLELATKDGHVGAFYNLGAIYDKGLGLGRDVREALRWFKLAADQRFAEAQLNLAILFGRGEGTAAEKRDADRWLNFAADNGNERARKFLQR